MVRQVISPTMTRVAVAQVKPVFMNRDATIRKGLDVIEEAARNGARLIAFPETWVPCYPLWLQGAAGWDDPLVKSTFRALTENSVSRSGPEVIALREAAAALEIAIVMGVNERDESFTRGTLYNSLLHIDAKGNLLGVRRKLMPTHGERMIWGMGDGTDLQVYDTNMGRLGSSICGEHWMPLNRFAMHSLGEQLHVGAFPDLPAFQQLAARSYAFEGRVFMLAAGMPLQLSDIPAEFGMRDFLASLGRDELLIGGSAIIGPDGEYVVPPVFGREEILYADLDIGRVSEEMLQFDTAGHYNRPDIFNVRIDKSSHAPISWVKDSGDGEKV